MSYSATPGVPYTYFGSTTSKSPTQMMVTGLNVNTPYYFTVQTYTSPNANHQNTVISDYNDEAIGSNEFDGDSDGVQ